MGIKLKSKYSKIQIHKNYFKYWHFKIS